MHLISRIALVLSGLSVSLIGSQASAAGSDNAPQAATPSASAVQQQASPSSITEQKFGKWAVQCTTDRAMDPPCQIIYRLASDDQKQIATVISMAKANGGPVGMQLALPLGFAIQGGVQISFGTKFSMSAAVSRCTIQGCLIEGTAPDKLLSAMLKETSGTITLRMLQGSNIVLPVDLEGFAQAYKTMSQKT